LLGVSLFCLNQVVSLIQFTLHCFMLVLRAHLLKSAKLPKLFHRRALNVLMLHLTEVELLGTEHAAWSRNSAPSDEGLRRDIKVFHRIDSDQGTCAA
jgi:hypothetical protein